MTSDLQALLAAIVADPSDDVARLVYADCLEEHGNAARAQFIRLQIEAERHHPDSNERARLEAEAETLFAEHWVEWWSEVCATVGLSQPQPAAANRRQRLARRVGLRSAAGEPYRRDRFLLREMAGGGPINGVPHVTFARGFPDTLSLTAWATHCLAGWSKAAPLYSLTADPSYIDNRFDGPHLSGVRFLELRGYHPDVPARLRSPHLTQLEVVALRLTPECPADDVHAFFANELAGVVSEPISCRLKRLSIPVHTDQAAELVAGADNLSELEALEVSVLQDHSDDVVSAGRRLSILAGSPHLAGLKELTVTGWLDDTGLTAAVRNPTWTGLRKLDINVWGRSLNPLADTDDLPELEELRLTGFGYAVEQLAALRRSPLLKQIRHFAVRSSGYWESDFEIADAVDPSRIETFAIEADSSRQRVVAMLRERFGDKLRVYSR